METKKAKLYHLVQIEGVKDSINHHRCWYCEVNDVEIHSNDDVLGNKFYIVSPMGPKGERFNLRWYETPTKAIIAYSQLREKAITE